MFARSGPGVQPDYAGWARGERLEPHAPGALTAGQLMHKLGAPVPADTNLRDHHLVVERAKDLEEATKDGPLRLFPEDQWEAVLLGPGIDGPNGPHTLIGFTQESIALARPSLSWHAFPTEDRGPESFFVHGDGQVLVPRLPTHQPMQVRNPFSNSSNLPLPPPPPFVPHPSGFSRSSSSLSGSHSSTPLSTNTSQSSIGSSSQSHLHTPSQGALGTNQHHQHHHTNSHTGNASQPPKLPPHAQTMGGHNQQYSHQPQHQGNQAYHGGHSHSASTPAPQLPDRSTQPASRYGATATALHTTPHPPTSSSASQSHMHSQSATAPYATTGGGAAKNGASAHGGPYATVQGKPAGSKGSSSSKDTKKKPGEYSDSKKPVTRAVGTSGSSTAAGTGLNASDPGAPPRCPDEISSGYCRSWNIMHQQVCPYSHHFWSELNDTSGLTSRQKFSMKKLVPGTPEFDYIKIRFINSWIHQSSKKPTVTKIKQVSCPLLEKLYNQRADAIKASGTKPNITELYHGTCEANFETLFVHGFQPPADYAPHPQCPVSGTYADKLATSLCKRTCRLCTSMPKHNWNVCHMWGLGIYCAIDSSKSDIYVSNQKGKKTDKLKRKMLLCSVILGEAENVKVLKTPGQMHDVVAPAQGKHSIFAVGYKNQAAVPTANGNTLGVVNDEYVVFHPHQIMPLYVIEYSKP